MLAFIYNLHLPLLDDHAILDSIDGLLVLHRDYDTAVRLLHPFTGDVAELPPLASLLSWVEIPHYYNEESKRSGLMSVRASVTVGSTGRITVMLAFDLLHRVAYATAGDQRWTFFTWKIQPLIKPVAFQGKLYAMEFLGKAIQKVCIYQIDPPHLDDAGELSHLPFPVKIAECPMDKLLLHPQLCRMLLGALASCLQCYSCSKLLVYRLADLVSGTIEPVRSIGNHALFMDERCLCFSLSPNKGSTNLSSLSPNSIICLHRVCLDFSPTYESTRFEQYDLGTGIWTPASDGDIVQRPPPCPYTLIHHILLPSQLLVSRALNFLLSCLLGACSRIAGTREYLLLALLPLSSP
ncbi:hypothetical protein HU200_005711 [Digitaria exilis]|uniref:KIB1-4 beta-propeller domain-containing protein n=1 Tax=Digitaria exilis TaxID=1010633 RepID=A0A835FSM1_9POAL|nr:hypothetical protein HU200_005711 [Digitaria exilis]